MPKAAAWTRLEKCLCTEANDLSLSVSAMLVPKFTAVGFFPKTAGRHMEFINRYVDRPLLDGASRALRAWHVRTGQSPERLGPSWNLAVLFVLLALSVRFLSGTGFVLGAATLVMLSLPSALKLMSNRPSQLYNARAYLALATLALRKRETEWALRLIILLISACLPILSRSDEPAGSWFLLGASLWFVLTAPANTYLQAAEPPQPSDGEPSFRSERSLQFGS